jgi:hypothetical protein
LTPRKPGFEKKIQSMGLLKKKYPWVTIVKYGCDMGHICALVVSNACKKLSKSLKDLCNIVCNHF